MNPTIDKTWKSFCKKMPVWIVELFGNTQLNRAFWTLNLLVMPFWCAMIFVPHNRIVKKVCHPFGVPVLFSCVYFYVLYLLVTVTGVPPLVGFELKALRKFVNHPLVFLVVWTHYLSVDLFLGMTIYRDSIRREIRIPLELLLCWVFGPIGLLAYGCRVCWLRITLR